MNWKGWLAVIVVVVIVVSAATANAVSGAELGVGAHGVLGNVAGFFKGLLTGESG